MERGEVIDPVFFEDCLAKRWEVNESISSNFIGDVHDLLLQRVDAEHLQRPLQILVLNLPGPHTGLQAAEHAAHVLCSQDMIHVVDKGVNAFIM